MEEIAIEKMLEKEIKNNLRLKVKTLYRSTNNNYEQAIGQIQLEKNPILYRFIKMKSYY
jgi:hypothetical protein